MQDQEAAPAQAVQALRAWVSFLRCAFCFYSRETAEISETATFDADEPPTVAHPGRPSYTHRRAMEDSAGYVEDVYSPGNQWGSEIARDRHTDAAWEILDAA